MNDLVQRNVVNMSRLRTLSCDRAFLEGCLGPWLGEVESLTMTESGARAALSRLERVSVTIADLGLTGGFHARLLQRTECLKDLSLIGQSHMLAPLHVLPPEL